MVRVMCWVRRIALHTSAAGFTMDFAHSLFGHAMFLITVWERTHEIVVPYAAFAATLIVYIDGMDKHGAAQAASHMELA